MTICGPFAVIHVLMNGSHHGGTRQRSDACFCEFLWSLCETKAFIPEAVNVRQQAAFLGADKPAVVATDAPLASASTLQCRPSLYPVALPRLTATE